MKVYQFDKLLKKCINCMCMCVFCFFFLFAPTYQLSLQQSCCHPSTRSTSADSGTQEQVLNSQKDSCSTNEGSESDKRDQHQFYKSDFMYYLSTFSKLWTLPWKIFTHRSLGAKGRTSQIRTTTRRRKSFINDHFEKKREQSRM